MTQIQRYIFFDALRALLIIVSGLVIMALLAQGLSQTDLLIESQQSALLYMKVVALGSPKVIGLLAPLGLFVACAWSLNRIHRDSEIVVAQAAGQTPWQTASPVMRLACMVALTHLTINLWVQPATQREMRETLHDTRADFASMLIRPGEFTTAGADLTFYARDNVGGELTGLLISDSNSGEPADYLANKGRVTKIEGKPALVMFDGQIQQIDEDGSLSILDFDQYVLDLAPFVNEQTDLIYKASDRYLPELVRIDATNYFENPNRIRFAAEANFRLTSPLLNFTMTLLAVLAVLGGDYQRAGYMKRIAIVAVIALGLLFGHLAANAAAVEQAGLNWIQWTIPLGSFVCVAVWHFRRIKRPNREPSI